MTGILVRNTRRNWSKWLFHSIHLLELDYKGERERERQVQVSFRMEEKKRKKPTFSYPMDDFQHPQKKFQVKQLTHSSAFCSTILTSLTLKVTEIEVDFARASLVKM